MTRRNFPGVLGGIIFSSSFAAGKSAPVVTLTAIAAARLPQTITIRTDSAANTRERIWELRTYTSAAPMLARRFASIFPRAGIRPLLSESDGHDLTYLIPFENLTARDRAWTLLNADPLWASARPRFESYRFGLYRVL